MSLSVSGVSIFAASGNSAITDCRIANNCRVKAATVASESVFCATMWCEKLMVLTSSSGLSGERRRRRRESRRPRRSDGFARSPRPNRSRGRSAYPRRASMRIASAVILLLTGPAADTHPPSGCGLRRRLRWPETERYRPCRIDAVVLQDHLEQIDIGRGAADDADAASGELRNFGDLRNGFLAFGFGRRGHPQHRDILAQRRHRLGVLRHVEIAPDDREIGLAVGQRLGARGGAIGWTGRRRIWLWVWVKACVSA